MSYLPKKKISVVHYFMAFKTQLIPSVTSYHLVKWEVPSVNVIRLDLCSLSVVSHLFNLVPSVKTLWLSSLMPNIKPMWVKLHIQLHKMWDKVEFRAEQRQHWRVKGRRCDKQHIWNRAPLFDPSAPVERLHNGVSFVEISAVGTFAALSSITFCHESIGSRDRKHMDGLCWNKDDK